MTNSTTNTTTKTVRELRSMLFSCNKYAVIEVDEMTNKEARDFLYNKKDQDEKFNVIVNEDHFLIWK